MVAPRIVPIISGPISFHHLTHRSTPTYRLRVLVLDAMSVHGSSSIPVPRHRPAAARARGGGHDRVDGIAALVAGDEEENRGEQQGGPGTPGEAKGVGADLGVAALAVEDVAHLDKGGPTIAVSSLSENPNGGKEVKRNIRHQRHSNRKTHERRHGQQPRHSTPNPAAQRQHPKQKHQALKKQGDQEENPSKPPHIPIAITRRPPAITPNQLLRRTRRISRPRIPERQAGAGGAAVGVVQPADLEVGPLGDGAGALDARGGRAQEIGLAEGGRVGHTREDDEPEEDEGAGC